MRVAPVGCAVRTVAPHNKQQSGYTLIELLIALALSAILFTGLGSVVGQALDIHDTVRDNNDLTQQARFAMQQMVRAVSRSPRLLLPLNDSSNTNWPDNLREETVPPSTPVGDSTLATAVLAVTLDPAAGPGRGRHTGCRQRRRRPHRRGPAPGHHIR